MTNSERLAQAVASGLYDVKTDADNELEWVQPKEEHTFAGVEEGFAERPTYVRCLNCSKIIRYSAGVWEQFSMEHGAMCRNERIGQ